MLSKTASKTLVTAAGAALPWTTRRRSDGHLVAFSLADCWLAHLWRHAGRSWSALEARVGRAPDAAGKHAALVQFRTRLAEADSPDPEALLSADVTVGAVEDALAWLGEPAAATAPATGDPALAALDIPRLVARLGGASPLMPRAAMETLIARGSAAVPALLHLLDGLPPAPDPLWAIVVLGELRLPAAIPSLGPLLGSPDADAAVAAAEALAKIGPRAVPLLVAVTQQGAPRARLQAYGALGSIRTAEAYRGLIAALARDDVFADVVGHALARHGRLDAVAPLLDRARRSPAPLRPALEAAVSRLIHGIPGPEPLAEDWRLRYRRLPRLGWAIPPSWTTIAAHASRRRIDDDDPRPPRRLAAIVADRRFLPRPRPCRSCGGRVWQPTGLPLCRHDAEALLDLQHAVLAGCLASGLADVWSALDACDRADAAPGDGRAPRRRTRCDEVIAVARGTLYWLAGLGREELRTDLRTARAYLDVIAHDLARLYDRDETSRRAATPIILDHPPKYS